jgi:hypothetical protein
VRADLQSKQSQLRLQMAAVKSQNALLSPGQRAALAAPAPAPVLADSAPDALPPVDGVLGVTLPTRTYSRSHGPNHRNISKINTDADHTPFHGVCDRALHGGKRHQTAVSHVQGCHTPTSELAIIGRCA